jgi:hypothetical protein
MIENKQLRKLLEAEISREDLEAGYEVSAKDIEHSEFNPANDALIGMMKELQQSMTRAARGMRPSHLAIAKLADKNMKTIDIAAQTRLTVAAVYNALRNPQVIKLRDTMTQYQGLLAGCTQVQRDNMLYRIAVRAEIPEPKIAIAALAELSKTEHNAKTRQMQQKQGGTSNQTVVVQIADARLKPSKLDDAPAHLIKDLN